MGVFKRWVKHKDGSKTAYWYGRYTLNSKEKWESFGRAGVITKGVAKVRLHERKRQVRLGQLEMINAQIPTFLEFANDYFDYVQNVKRNRSSRRTKQALEHFKRFIGNKLLSEISPEDIDDYKVLRQKAGRKPATVNRELSVIKSLFNYAWRSKKYFGRNPVSLAGILEANNLMERILTPEEESRLLEVSEGYLKDIIIIALNTGMRQGEILGLKWDWIDFEKNFISIPQTNTKSKKERKVPINSVLKTLLLERKLAVGNTKYVFPSPRGVEKNLAWVKRSFKTACKKAGIENLRFHDLRHTAATRLVDAGIPLHAIAKLLGHSTVRVTERYSHPEESVKEAVEILGNFNKKCSNFRSNERLGNDQPILSP